MISKVFCRQYRYALLNKDEKLIAELEKNVLSNGATASEIENEKLWVKGALPLVAEAIELRKQGCSIRSSKFDALEKRANQVGFPLPVYLRGIIHSADAIEYHATSATSIPSVRNNSKSLKKKEASPKKQLKTKSIDWKPVPKQKPVSKGELKRCLEDFKKAVLYKSNDENQVQILRDEIIHLYPDAAEKVNQIVEIGKALGNAFEAGQSGKSDEDFEISYEKLIESIAPEDKSVQSHIRSMFFRGKTIRDWESYRSNEFSDDHPNFLSNLQPSKKWTILIDEAGDCFFNDAKDGAAHSRGRLAAIIVPDYCKLPDLSANFHCRDLPNEVVKQIVDAIIQSPCGVLGIPVDALRKNDCELWYTGIETLIDLIIHLLPIDGKTFLDILVEQRTEYTPEKSAQLNDGCLQCLKRLARSNPYRAEMIDVSARFINKSDHPWNGYADTIAHCWGGFSVSVALKDSRWINSCLLDFKPDLLRQIVHSVLRTKPLSEKEWKTLVARPSSGCQKMIANLLLKIQGEEARHDVNCWKKYYNYAQKQLNSGSVDLCASGKLYNWLTLYAPNDVTLSHRRHLLWLTNQLTRLNHQGKTDFVVQYQKKLEELCAVVFPKDAHLTCQTTLQVAQAYINDFNFKAAYDAVKGWIGVDKTIPGSLYYGQILSTIGQLNAFIGQRRAAIEACNLAIDQFEKVKNQNKRESNINQTLSYKVIAMMDSQTIPENMNQEMERYLGRTLMEAAERFAVTNNDNEKYMHHVFLRYLVHVNSPELKPIIDKYLSLASEWKTGNGHPWEMIQYYRALLQTELSNKKMALELAYYNVFRSNNETLDVIACVILGSLYYYNARCKNELEELTQKVIETMPYLGKKRIEALTTQLKTPQEPLALAKAVLPFNFR